MHAILILMTVVALSGCGKTITKLTEAVKALIDVPAAAYDDGKDNAETAKKTVLDPATAPAKP